MFTLAPLVYVQITPRRLILHNPKKAKTRIEAAEMAIAMGHARTVLAVGNYARSAVVGHAHALLVRPFDHPRSLVSDFVAAQHLLKELVREFAGNRLFALSPHLLLHPQGRDAGGYTAIEVRAFREMGLATGASTVQVWHGPVLTDKELLERNYNPEGALLLE